MLAFYFVYLRPIWPFLALCSLSGLFISEPGIHLWLHVISLVCLSQNQTSTYGYMLSLWFVYLRTRHPLMAIYYLWFVYLRTRHSLMAICYLFGLSQNQVSTYGYMLSLWFVYLRTRHPLMVICYLFGLFVSEPGVPSWLYVVTLFRSRLYEHNQLHFFLNKISVGEAAKYVMHNQCLYSYLSCTHSL